MSAAQGSLMLLGNSLLAWPMRKKTAYFIIFIDTIVVTEI